MSCLLTVDKINTDHHVTRGRHLDRHLDIDLAARTCEALACVPRLARTRLGYTTWRFAPTPATSESSYTPPLHTVTDHTQCQTTHSHCHCSTARRPHTSQMSYFQHTTTNISHRVPVIHTRTCLDLLTYSVRFSVDAVKCRLSRLQCG